MPYPGSHGGKAALINMGGRRTNLQAAEGFSELHDSFETNVVSSFLFYFI